MLFGRKPDKLQQLSAAAFESASFDTRYLAAGIAGLINVYRPEIIIIGGGVSNEGEFLMVPLNKYIAEYSYGNGLIEPPKAVQASLGNDAGIIGAAMLGIA